MRLWSLLLVVCALSGCRAYDKQILTGSPMTIDNVYAKPGYDHTGILNLLLLPVNNPHELRDVERHHEDLVASVLRNFGKFNYFNVYYDHNHREVAGPVMDLSTGRINRTLLGEIGQHYGAQAVMQIDIEEFRPFAPMRMKVRGTIIDTNTGERIWQFHHVFDSDDADVVNSMRIWWNTRAAGGDSRSRFELGQVRPSVFSNFVFYLMARSYERTRVMIVEAVEDEDAIQNAKDKEVELLQSELEPQVKHPSYE